MEYQQFLLPILGGINQGELLRTFNCGIGGIVIVSKDDEDTILSLLQEYSAVPIGKVVDRNEGKISRYLNYNDIHID